MEDKIPIIIFLIIIAILLIGFITMLVKVSNIDKGNVEEVSAYTQPDTNRFVVLSAENLDEGRLGLVVVDKETKVEYIILNLGTSQSTIMQPLYKADGTLLVYGKE